MLTMAFLGIDNRRDLPQVSYSTALDYFLGTCHRGCGDGGGYQGWGGGKDWAGEPGASCDKSLTPSCWITSCVRPGQGAGLRVRGLGDGNQGWGGD